MTRREFPKSVRLAAWQRANGRCEGCGAMVFPGKHQYHHKQEDTFGGEPTLENCEVLCIACHDYITRKQAGVIAKSNRVRARHIGIKKPTQKIRAWRRFNGEVVFADRRSK